MISIKFKELLAAKERVNGERISLDDISKETGISIATLSRLGSPRKYTTNTDILDRLCQYFGSGICELIEFHPDEKKAFKILGISDIKKRRRALEEQLPSYVLSKLPSLGLELTSVKFNQLYLNQNGTNKFSVDITGQDNAGNLHFIAVKPLLYHTQTLNYLKELFRYEPFRILVITCSDKFPVDLANTNMPGVDFFVTKVIFDEIRNQVIGLDIDKSSLVNISTAN
jgi:Predicted transcriptional regulator